MNYRMIGRIIGQILGLEALFLLLPLAICLADGDEPAVLGFTLSVLISAGVYLRSRTLCRLMATTGAFLHAPCCCEQVPEKPFLPPPSPQDRKRLWPSSRRA